MAKDGASSIHFRGLITDLRKGGKKQSVLNTRLRRRDYTVTVAI